MIKSFLIYFLPPILIDLLKQLKRIITIGKKNYDHLDIYSKEKMANILENWGERNAWIEIQHIFFSKDSNSKILDIACGTGTVIKLLNTNLKLRNIYGCDISKKLIDRAKSKNINSKFLKLCDATNLPYLDSEFDYSYSIGSLEHFSHDGIVKFLKSCRRVTRKESYHLIPVSRTGKNYGWITTYQSYFNNSVDWWKDICINIFPKENILIIDSSWEDKISVGKWLILKS